MQLVNFDERFVQKLYIVELKIQSLLHMVDKRAAARILGAPGRDGVREVMLADQGFADDIGICDAG